MNSTPDNGYENGDVDNYLYEATKLLLDDDKIERTPESIYKYTKNPIYTYPHWDRVHSYEEFVEYIKTHPMPKATSFDHDLADVHYLTFLSPSTTEARQKAWTEFHDQEGEREMTGYDCLKWLIEYCHDNNVVFPLMLIHTMNTVGYNNMVFYYRAALRNKFIRLN